MIRFANEESCEACGGRPTRLRYGDDEEDDVFLCEEHYGGGRGVTWLGSPRSNR